MKNVRQAVLVFGLICALFVGLLYVRNDIGVAPANLESYIRSSQKIPDDWVVDGSVSDTMAAYIFYPQDMNGHTFLSMCIVLDSPLDISFVVVEAFQELIGESQSLP